MYLIIGGSGFLGRYIIKSILELTTENVLATYSTKLPTYKNDRLKWINVDIQNCKHIEKLSKTVNESTKVIYLCSYHHPDKVQLNPGLAWDINITSLAFAINKLSKAGCFYYSSTDSVYGESGQNTIFKENDKTKPVNLYGKHKVLAEEITIAAGRNVIRFPFIIGPSLVESKKHFFDIIFDDINSNKQVEMFNDSYRSTLSFNQCANLLVKLIEKYGACKEKIINIASDTPISKYDVAIKMCEEYNLDKKYVKPISIKESANIFHAKRAMNTVLDNSKIKKLLNLQNIELEF